MSAIERVERLGLALSVGLFCPSKNVDQGQSQRATPSMTTEICTHLAKGEALPPISAWPQELGQGILAVRGHCADILKDPDMCPLATSVGVLKTAETQPGKLPEGLIEGARDLLKKAAETYPDERTPDRGIVPKRVSDPVR